MQEGLKRGSKDLRLDSMRRPFQRSGITDACRRKGLIRAFPFCKVSLNVHKPQPLTYPSTPQTCGNHIRKRRLDVKLFQKDAARLIGVDTITV